VIGRFIVDFLAPRQCLVVEVDGGYHATRAGADARSLLHPARLVVLPEAPRCTKYRKNLIE
jgi:hypothetical protein